jgi:dipeptidyl aminopeptidase/acylaminoacyl peptidase
LADLAGSWWYFKGEDHWLSHGSTRLQMLEACVAFLRAHNPPD